MDYPSLIGQELGNYVVDSLIGEGGMGAVYASRHRFLGTRVAIKVLHGSYANHPQIAERFFQEAKSSIAIKHPGIIQILDFGQRPDGALYLVMELLEGRTLAEAITEGKFGEGATARVGAELADALAAAHACGIIHRDLKPDNIFLTGEQVKILDFGIAKVIASSTSGTKTGSVFGTPLYMAPEQAKGSKHVTPRTDVYALGAILFEMLVGAPPFEGEDATVLLSKHLFSPPPRPSLVASVSPVMEALILECLAKEPAERPPDMAAVRDRLNGIKDAVQGSYVPTVAPRTAHSASTISDAAAEMAAVLAAPPPKPASKTNGLRATLGAAILLGMLAVGVAALTLRPSRVNPPLSTAAKTTVERSSKGPESAPPVAAEKTTTALSTPPTAAPEFIEIHLLLVPPDARVELDGIATQINPLRVPSSTVAHRLVVSAPGHTTVTRELRAEVSGELRIVLPGRERPARAKAQPAPSAPSAPATSPKTRNVGPMENEL